MAEEQIIIEVVVDNDAAQKSVTEQTRKIEILNNSTKKLKETNKDLSEDYGKNRKQIEANNEQIAKNAEVLGRANATRKDSIKSLKLQNNSLNAQKLQQMKNIGGLADKDNSIIANIQRKVISLSNSNVPDIISKLED